MKELNFHESNIVSAGIWCTYDGKPCSGCANMIQIDGNDCSVITSHINVNKGHFDAGSLIFGIAAGWSTFIVTFAACAAFGLGTLASGGIGLILSTAIATGYIASH